MKAYEIVQLIEKAAPPKLAYEWDNVGILCGSGNKEVRKVYLTLDVNEYTVNEAIRENCDMIISHHPILMEGIKRISYSEPEGRIIRDLIEKDITVFAAHTNMDTAENGINTVLAKLFNLKNIQILEKNGENTGLGRYGKTEKTISFEEFIKMVKIKLNTPCVRASGDFKKRIETAAVASGSCSDLIPAAVRAGCDVIVTADIKYHNMMDSVYMGIAVIDAGHYPTEIIVMDIFENILKDTNLQIYKSSNKDIFNYV